MTGAAPATGLDLAPEAQYWRASLVVISGLARAARDLDLLSPGQGNAIEAAAAAPVAPAGAPASLFEAAVSELARAGGLTPDELHCGLPPVGVASVAAHLAIARALKEQLLVALYRLENRPWDAPHTPVLVARGRRRIVQAGESLREVAMAHMPADPRDRSATELAARAIGYVNRDTRSQLKQTTLALEPGGTTDAFLECEALLHATLSALAEVVGPCPATALPTGPVTPAWWESAALALLTTIARASVLV